MKEHRARVATTGVEKFAVNWILARRPHDMHGVLQRKVVVRRKPIELWQWRRIRLVIDEMKWEIQLAELSRDRLFVDRRFSGTVDTNLNVLRITQIDVRR